MIQIIHIHKEHTVKLQNMETIHICMMCEYGLKSK